jgi:hypothetical protein
MNYLREINSFYDWLETNSISDSGIVLWHALMHINNKAGWIREFAVAISTLETKTGLKKGAIIRARLRLQQAGRIEFKSRTGQQSAIYSMVPFNVEDNLCSIKERKVEHKPDTNSNANRTQSGTQTGPINKLNETKLKEKNINNSARAREDEKAVDNFAVCPKCGGQGWYVVQVPLAYSNETKSETVTCDCVKNKRPSWADRIGASV